MSPRGQGGAGMSSVTIGTARARALRCVPRLRIDRLRRVRAPHNLLRSTGLESGGMVGGATNDSEEELARGRLVGRDLMVTGGTHGIGRAIVPFSPESGARVVALDRDQVALVELSAEVFQDELMVHTADVIREPGSKPRSPRFGNGGVRPRSWRTIQAVTRTITSQRWSLRNGMISPPPSRGCWVVLQARVARHARGRFRLHRQYRFCSRAYDR